jgi:hypothetical protein
MENARANMEEKQPVRIQSMIEVLTEMMGYVPAEMTASDNGMMYVMTNETKINGAAAMILTDKLDEFAQDRGTNVFILPSSIHEILLVKDSGDMSVRDLENMVREVNATQVSPEEQLTDHVYHYDSKDHIFEMADKFVTRQAEREAGEHECDKESLLGNLKAKKEEAAKEKPEKSVKEATKKSREGEAL